MVFPVLMHWRYHSLAWKHQCDTHPWRPHSGGFLSAATACVCEIEYWPSVCRQGDSAGVDAFYWRTWIRPFDATAEITHEVIQSGQSSSPLNASEGSLQAKNTEEYRKTMYSVLQIPKIENQARVHLWEKHWAVTCEFKMAKSMNS